MLEKSAVAEHVWKDHYSIRRNEATVVDKAKRPGELSLKEALHIYMYTLLSNASTGTLGLRSLAALRNQEDRTKLHHSTISSYTH